MSQMAPSKAERGRVCLARGGGEADLFVFLKDWTSLLSLVGIWVGWREYWCVCVCVCIHVCTCVGLDLGISRHALHQIPLYQQAQSPWWID